MPEESRTQAPMRLSPLAIGKAAMREFKSDDVPEIAASVAYHAIFAIPPMIVFIVALAALVNRVTDVPVAEKLITVINDNAPGDTRNLLLNMVDNAVSQVGGGAALFGVLVALLVAVWSSSNGVATVIKAFNRAYDVDEQRSFIRMKLVSIGLTVLVGAMLIVAIALLVFGKPLGNAISDWLGLGDVFDRVWGIGQFIAPIVFMFLLLAILYHVGPNVRRPFKLLSAGSFFATFAWIGVLFGFRIYLTFSNPGSAYGVMGSVVVLLFFLYVSSIVFILGAEINAVIERHFMVTTGEQPAVALASPTDAAEEETHAPTSRKRTPSRLQAIGTRIILGIWSLMFGALVSFIARKRRPRD